MIDTVLNMDIQPLSNYPLPSTSALQQQYVGKHLTDLPTPIPILDRAIVKRNCNAMLDVCKALGVGFRAHVKSHKTLELSKLQIGEDADTPANFVVSTLIEAEQLLPCLLEYQAKGRQCSILYGVPIAQSAVARLLALAKLLKPATVSILIDNADAFRKIQQQMQHESTVGVYIKIDTGYHRAGIQTDSPKFDDLVQAVAQGGHFQGFYSHFGHSYGGSSQDDAVHGLLEELKGLQIAAKALPSGFNDAVVLTVGATPTATAAQNMLASAGPKLDELKALITSLKTQFIIELHAGVYPILDLQQVATHARPSTGSPKPGFQPLSTSSIGSKILVEVSSVYDEREKPEALISAGSLAMGREPCKSYPGWGVVTGELGNKDNIVYDDRGDRTGWIIGRISQEHGILSWEGPKEKMKPLTIGDRLLIWPNHACVAGAGFGWYLIVDSDLDSQQVVDVWVRWRGW